MLLSNGTATPIPSAALAELTPQVQQGWYYPTSTGISLERSFVLYNSLYRFQPWIRTVVDKIANAVARLTINVWDVAQTPEGATLRTLDTKSPYAALIANPNDQMDPYRFWQWVAATIEIYGEAYLLKVRTGRRVTSLIPMHPSRIVVVRHPDTGEELYLWNGAAGSDGMLTFTSDEVIPLRLYSPEGAERGLSRLESLRSTLFSEDSSRTATSAMWRNAGMPNFMITSPKKLSQDAADRLRKQFDSIHAGSQNAGKTLVLEEGMEVKPVQLTAVEMQFIQSRQLNREEICGVYDIAEPMVQILDRATFCLPAEAQISTGQGPKSIVDVQAGDQVWSYNAETHAMELAPVEWSGKTGDLPLYTVRTANRTLRATGNHPVLVGRHKWVEGGGQRGKRRRREGYYYEWVRVDELQPGDLMVAGHGFATASKRTHAPNGREVTEELMEFCGLLLGDGTVNKNTGVSIAHAENAFYIDHYRHCAEALFTRRGGEPISWHKSSERSSRFSSATAARELTELGFSGNAYTKSIPGWVFECSEVMRFALLRGIVEADGSVDKKGRISFSLCNEHMVNQVRDLMIGLGVPVTNVRHTNYEVTLPNGEKRGTSMWCFTASDPGQNRFIGTWDDRDFERLMNGKPFDPGYYRYAVKPKRNGEQGNVIEPPAGAQLSMVKEITKSDDVVPVYDLTVPGNHSFVADGLVVHNSNISAQMRAFYRDTMAPRLELIESALNAGLGGNFNGSKRVEFAVADVLRGDYETRGAAVAQLVQVGVMKPSEGRQLMDLSDGGEVADRLYANSAIQPLGAAPDGQPAGAGPSSEQPALEPTEDTDEPTDTDEPDEEPKGLIVAKTATQTRYVRAVKGVIGRGARDAEIRALAVKLAARNPGDLEDILRAVQIAIEERDS